MKICHKFVSVCVCVCVCVCVTDTHLGGEVSHGLELFEEGGEEEGGEEEDDGPEEDVGDVGAIMATGRADELTT